jgi:aminotransferase EvaB
MRGYSYLKYKKGDFPVAEKSARQIFSLPMYPQLKQKEILKVVKALKKIGV